MTPAAIPSNIRPFGINQALATKRLQHSPFKRDDSSTYANSTRFPLDRTRRAMISRSDHWANYALVQDISIRRAD